MNAGAAAEEAAIPALVSEVARIRDRYEGPTAVVTSRGKARTASFREVCVLGRSADVVVDGGGREVRSSGECTAFARRPVLFEVLRVLAEAWPGAVPRDVLIARVFGARRPNESHRIRLRVEVGRLRKLARPRLGVVAEGPGYALSATGEVVLVMPLEESPASRLLSLMHGGEAWSASSLAHGPRRLQRADHPAEPRRAAERGEGRPHRQRSRAAMGTAPRNPDRLVTPAGAPRAVDEDSSVREKAPAKELIMNTMSSTQSPSTRQKATVVREYGPFPVEGVHGVTHDGTHVWFAHGEKLAAMNPETGAIEKELDVVAEAGTAFDGEHLYQIGEDKIRKVDPKTGCAQVATRSRRCYDEGQLGPRLGPGHALGRAVQGARHPSDRRDDRQGAPDAALRSLRDRGVVRRR